MDYNYEITHNASMLRKCKKAYNFTAISYFITCIPFSFISFYIMILTVGNNVFLMFLDAVFKAAIFFLGYLSIYQHNNKLAYYAVGVGVSDNIICGFDLFILGNFNVILLAAYTILCTITIRTNKKYFFLEQQEGFPYFNERFEEQKAVKDIDIYAERYKEIKKASSGKNNMDEL